MKVLVTGGCGFIGTNLAIDRLTRGDEVVVFDNRSRSGTDRNWGELESLAAVSPLTLVQGDVRDAALVASLALDVDVIFHLAAQVAVTTSVEDPRADFEVNALGTLNVLEASRLAPTRPAVVYASTNKVYGGLTDMRCERRGLRYVLPDLPLGVAETQQLDFHSPYGCSKGAADQYVLDYARIYGIDAVVLRQSCIYGIRQFGSEDQGWVAHFVAAALAGRPITVFGNGLQVRDVLCVDDLILVYDAVLNRLDVARGRAYNVGGGAANTVSLKEFVQLLPAVVGEPMTVDYAPWRPGDQRVYVSDIRRAAADLEWAPSTRFIDGLHRLGNWLRAEAATLEVQ